MLYIEAIVIKRKQILCWRKESSPNQFIQNYRPVAKRCELNVLHRISCVPQETVHIDTSLQLPTHEDPSQQMKGLSIYPGNDRGNS